MVFLPFGWSFCARKAAWSVEMFIRSFARAATAAATAWKRVRASNSRAPTGVYRLHT